MAGTLQKKFIAAAMLTVTILLLTLVSAINILHFFSITGQQKKMLTILMEMDVDTGPVEKDAADAAQTGGLQPGGRSRDGWREAPLSDHRGGSLPGGLTGPGFSMDDALSRRFFVVWLDAQGQIVRADVSRIYAVTEESALEMAQRILEGGKRSGRYGSFRFLLGEQEREDTAAQGSEEALPQETYPAAKLVVMDISRDMAEIWSVLGISILIAIVCWIVMLLPAHALTRLAIAPAARSIERQKQFVTNAGHELKTPLAIIQANTDALALFNGESKWTRNIRAQTVRLDGLMQNLLTLSRMDENALPLRKTAVRLDALVLEVWDSFAESARAGGLSADLPVDPSMKQSADLPEDLSTVQPGDHPHDLPVDPFVKRPGDHSADLSGDLHGGEKIPGREESGSVRRHGKQHASVQAYADRDTIAQLLSILFDNAVKYTPGGGEIRVRTWTEGGSALLSQSNTVSSDAFPDAGPDGSIPADPERLFERFYRTDADRSRKKGGYGIGLSAARAIAEANGGTIHAHLEEGRLVFTLRLPGVKPCAG